MSEIPSEPGVFESLFSYQAELLSMAGLLPIQIRAQQRRLREELRQQVLDVEFELSLDVQGAERSRLEADLRHARAALCGYREVRLAPDDHDVDPVELRRAEARCAECFGHIHSNAEDEREREIAEMLFDGRFFPPSAELHREMIRDLDKLLGLD